jgi:flagellin
MTRALNALIDVNQQMGDTQNRINTGKQVNEASDNIAIYFKARSYNDRADLYDNVNANVTQAMANLTFVDKALSNMIDNVKGARQMLVDARAKPVAIASAVSFTGKQAYAVRTINVGGTTRTINGQIVDPNSGVGANANVTDGSYFQAGDVFRVDLRDSSNNTTVTRFFRAVAPDQAAAPDQSGRGASTSSAIEFNDLASLANALNLGFGRASASFDPTYTTTGSGPLATTTARLSMSLASNTQSITFGQVTDATVNVPGGPTNGDSFDFSKLLQDSRGASVTVGNTLDGSGAPGASSWTYSPSQGTTTDQSSVDTRRQAADFFRQTIYGLDATVKDAYMPGFANLLRSESMTVALNDTGTVSQTVKLNTAINFTASSSLNATFGVALGISNQGSLTTELTDGTGATTDNFQSDTLLSRAITRLDNMSVTLGQQRQLLAASKTAMSSRLDLNKMMASSMRDTANAMTAADIAQETTSLAALQNRQSFAATSLSITRQSDQYLLNLLR